MKRPMHRLVCAAVLLSSVSLAHGQAPRLAAFALHCFVPTPPSFHTRATLVGTFTLAQRTVRTVASCQDGPSPARWPEFAASDGDVQALEVSVTTVLENAQHWPVAYNACTGRSSNGYLTLRCLADEQQGGEVHVLVSIAP
jgi:hypothetical protein